MSSPPPPKQTAVYFPHASWGRSKALTLYNVWDQEGGTGVITRQPALSQVLLHLQRKQVPVNTERQASYTQRWASSKKGIECSQQSQAQRGNLPLQWGPGERYIIQRTRKSAQVGGIPGATGCNVNSHISLKTLGDICCNLHTMTNALHFIWRDNSHKN